MESLEDYIKGLESGGISKFDLYKQNPADWDFLSEVIPGLVITSAGGILPYQAEGTLHGLPFYFRCRHEQASIRLVAVGENAVSGSTLYTASTPAPHMINDEQFIELLIHLVSSLKPAEFRWEFMGRKVTVDKNLEIALSDDEEEISYGWGFTPEEGFLATREHSEYLLEHGFSHDLQDQIWEAKKLNPVPVNSDNRNWPNPEPVFEVKLP